MTKNTKLLLMFAPLVLLFAGFAVVVSDLRHPRITEERCKVSAVGAEVSSFRPKGRYIYRQSENPLHDVRLECGQSGTLLLNDLQLRQTPIQRGQEAKLLHKQFRILPERWDISVHTGPQTTPQ